MKRPRELLINVCGSMFRRKTKLKPMTLDERALMESMQNRQQSALYQQGLAAMSQCEIVARQGCGMQNDPDARLRAIISPMHQMWDADRDWIRRNCPPSVWP